MTHSGVEHHQVKTHWFDSFNQHYQQISNHLFAFTSSTRIFAIMATITKQKLLVF